MKLQMMEKGRTKRNFAKMIPSMKEIATETLKKELKGGKCGNARLTMPAIYHLTVKTASDPNSFYSR